MAFQGIELIYDGELSTTYGLYIMDLNAKSETEIINYDVIKDKTNLSKFYTFGMVENTPLSFPLTLMSEKPLTSYEISAISKAFFNSRKYKKLQIMQDDMSDYYYMCKFNKVKLVPMSNNNVGFRFTVECDCPYAYELPKKIVRNSTGTPLKISIDNDCDTGEEIYPVIKLYPNVANSTITIVNSRDSKRECKITNTRQGEVITLRGEQKIIQSDKAEYMYERFNNKFVKLLPNLNELTITGGISKVEIEYQFKRRVGVN